ncbi:Receptor-like protein kinase 2 [Camellia lanceoleosa]|uniref:Receptor-like protein kinase 2 n=1 Tax=Camellia lanceoleosa TaxID=1840588 RepID=A0ACC0HVZ1_9ERIC|nr:Receptor-like protein kinase 2 [Camellia lanceoleosa]
MVKIGLSANAFSGNLPTNNGLFLPNLEVLLIEFNQLTGNIPPSLCNSSKLTILGLAANLFTGPVPKHLGNLKHLERLTLYQNQLTNELGSIKLSFLTDLTNCTSLVVLEVNQNKLSGTLPNSIGNLSNSLEKLFLSGNQLVGTIPKEIGSLRNLNVLSLANSNLNGNIPSTLGEIKSLQRFYLGGNNFHGSIPNEICLLSNLGELYAEYNKLSGSIPSCIENLREYGSDGRVSTNGDIYSYGMMLLETFTRKKPTDEMFSAEINLRQWVSASLPNKIMEIVDGDLLRMQNGSDMVTSQRTLFAILELGLECTSDIPVERSDIKKVLVKLNKIKKQLLHIQSI